jgi:uncharacterized membrane protein YhhN
MEPQTFLYIIGNVLFIIGLLLAKVTSWSTLIGHSVWQLLLLVLYAVGINCMVTGGCGNYAWGISIALVVIGTLQFLSGLYSVATLKRRQEPLPRERRTA